MKLCRIGADRFGSRADRDLDLLAPRVECRREVGHHRLRQRARVAQGDVERFLPGVEPCQPQEVLDETLHAQRVALDDLEEPLAFVSARVALEQHLDVSANRRQRRSQLVRHVGHEVAADLVDAPELGDVVQHDDRAVRDARAWPAPRAP